MSESKHASNRGRSPTARSSSSLHRALTGLLTLLTASAAVASEAGAQRRAPPEGRERVLEIGPRFGFDYREDALVLGGQLRVPIDPWQRVDFMPNFDITFESGITERQFNLDGAVYIDGARAIYLGGGAAFRNTIYPDDDGTLRGERETRTGYSIFAGLHGGRAFSTFVTQIELRWSFVDPFEPRTISLGLNYPIPLGF